MTDICRNPDFLSIIAVFKTVIEITFIIVPVILIIFVMIDVVKGVAGGPDKIKKIFSDSAKRIIAAVLIFFVAIIVDLGLGIVGGTSSKYSNCYENATSENITGIRVELAEEAVSLAENNRTQQNVSDAAALVDAIADEDIKTALQSRVDIMQGALNDIKESQRPNIAITDVTNNSDLTIDAYDATVTNNDFEGIYFDDGQIDKVAYYSQTDSKWRNDSYADGTINSHGCGPAAMAIIISTLTGENHDVPEMAELAAKLGGEATGGTTRQFIRDSAEEFGLTVDDKDISKQDVIDALENEKLVVAIMGRGNFSNNAHFIVLRGLDENGKILVADPASLSRSKTAWNLETIWLQKNPPLFSGGPLWIISE